MDKKVYRSQKEENKRTHKALITQYKKTRPPLTKRLGKILNRAKYPFVVANESIGRKIHKKRNDIRELQEKTTYIVDSLKATRNASDEIRKETVEDIIKNIDDL